MKTSFSLSENFFFSPELRTRLGRAILFIAIGSFLLHLALYTFYAYFLRMEPAGLLSSPINAIYTPFSFLLVYEAYLLLYYLQHSTSIYVGKQYEIIVLILIRGIFKDMTHLDLNQDNFLSANNIEFWYDLGAVIILFILILLFYRISGKNSVGVDGSESVANANIQLQRFISSKRILATILFLITLAIGIYSFGNWLLGLRSGEMQLSTPNLNAIFFDHFFTLLILSDVLILLFSLFYTDEFPIIIRNSSFVISTILLKLSFGAESGVSQLFIIAGVSFGVGISAITSWCTRRKPGIVV
jgi:hypothetical protein